MESWARTTRTRTSSTRTAAACAVSNRHGPGMPWGKERRLQGGGAMTKLGQGALFLFCYLDVVAVLAIGDWISDVGPLLLYGSPAAFATGFVTQAAHDVYRRNSESNAPL